MVNTIERRGQVKKAKQWPVGCWRQLVCPTRHVAWPFLLNASSGRLTGSAAISRWLQGIRSTDWPQLAQSPWRRTSSLRPDGSSPCQLHPSPASSATATRSRASVSRGEDRRYFVQSNKVRHTCAKHERLPGDMERSASVLNIYQFTYY